MFPVSLARIKELLNHCQRSIDVATSNGVNSPALTLAAG